MQDSGNNSCLEKQREGKGQCGVLAGAEKEELASRRGTTTCRRACFVSVISPLGWVGADSRA